VKTHNKRDCFILRIDAAVFFLYHIYHLCVCDIDFILTIG
jgi:hypothetical protein